MRKPLEHLKPVLLWPVFVLVLIIFTSGFAARADQVVNRIVATVNEDVITLFDLETTSRPYLEKMKSMNYAPSDEAKMIQKVKKEVLDKMIQEKLKDQELRKYDIKVDEAEIDRAVERFKKANFLTDEALEQGLAQEGMTLADYREKIREEMLRARLINYEIRSKIVITREEVMAYYETHPEKYAGQTRYHLRNIIMFVPQFAGEAEKEGIRRKMEGVLEKLEQGKSFESMARLYSESSLAAEGGDIGFFKLDDLSRQLRDVVSQLKPGQFSRVIDTQQGYQILFVEEIDQTGGKTLEQATPEIEDILYQERVETKFKEWLANLREQAHIEIYE